MRANPIATWLYSSPGGFCSVGALRRIPADDYELAERVFKAPLPADAGVEDFNPLRYDHDRIGFPTRPEVWQSVVPILRWRDRQLVSIDLHPLTLGFGLGEDVRGRPLLAEGEPARKIIAELQRMSAAFGTTIVAQEGIGQIRP